MVPHSVPIRVCAIVKYPPIQGGVSAQTYALCHLLAARGHQIHVVTNADDVEPEHRVWFLDGDADYLEREYPNGGYVQVHYTRPREDQQFSYIPRGTPAVTRLAAVATETIRSHSCEVIYARYFEPYAVAAFVAAQWTQTPFVVSHAGSDLFSLAVDPELALSYKEVVRNAATFIALESLRAGLGLSLESSFGLPGFFLPADFSPDSRPMSIPDVARELRQAGSGAVTNVSDMEPGVPMLGIYGKLGEVKGTFDLIRVLGELKRSGAIFRLAAVGGGDEWSAVIAAIRRAGLDDVSWTLPMLAPWQIPFFISSCTALAYLERDFPIIEHRPGAPLESLAVGKPVLLSRDITSKILPGFAPCDPVFDAVVEVDVKDYGQLAQGVLQVLHGRPGRSDAIAPLRRSLNQIGLWYENMFASVIQSHPLPPLRPRVALKPATVEALVRKQCPATAAHLGGSLRGEIGSGLLSCESALIASYWLTERLLKTRHAEPELRQLMTVEHRLLWLQVDTEGMAGIPTFPVPSRGKKDVRRLSDEEFGDLRPVATSWLRIDEYSIDAIGYLEELRAGRARFSTADLVSLRFKQIILSHKRPNLTGTMYRVNRPTATVIAACGGTETVRELVDAWTLRGVNTGALRQVIAELQEAGVLEFAHSTADMC